MDLKQLGGSAAKGMGQIMLQESALTGALFLIGIAICSPLLAAAAAIGSVLGCLVGERAGFEQKEVEAGLYGFNAALSAMVPFVFFAVSMVTLLLAVAAAAASVYLMRAMQRRGISPYTAPFVISGWAIYVVGTAVGLDAAPVTAHALPALPAGVVTGVGQVVFQECIVSGALFIVAIALCSKKAAAFACGGSLLGGCLAIVLNQPSGAIASGLFGCNSALCAIAMKDRGWRSAALAAALSVGVLIGFRYLGWPALTAPFVIATWVAGYRLTSKLA